MAPLIFFSVISCGITMAAPAERFPPATPPTNDIRIDNLVPIRMCDGATLYADVYRPAKEGHHPVLVSRTTYSTERYPTAYEIPGLTSTNPALPLFRNNWTNPVGRPRGPQFT